MCEFACVSCCAYVCVRHPNFDSRDEGYSNMLKMGKRENGSCIVF